jgi:uroporphyrin-III C-methyltransferase/precorrin-2 dehydrogenase/sirohydrochlorin ferrochelatase
VEYGKRVCRHKWGVPLLFGRVGVVVVAVVGGGLRFQIVPGVSGGVCWAAFGGIPLTLRGLAQTVVLTTGHTQDDDAAPLDLFKPGQTLALYMGVAQYATLGKALIEHGHAPDTPVAIVENGTTERQRVIRATLATLAAAQVELDVHPPALLLIGETTRLAQRYAWFAPSSLHVFADSSADGIEERAQRVL